MLTIGVTGSMMIAHLSPGNSPIMQLTSFLYKQVESKCFVGQISLSV